MSTHVRENQVLPALFARLDQWRHLPSYKLEPRVDAIFSLYVPEVVEEFTGVTVSRTLVPEFPIRRGTLWGSDGASPNRSVKVDFLLPSRDGLTFFLVEFKTDVRSRRDEQDAYLEQAVKLGPHALIDGLLQIIQASSQKYLPKYVHHLYMLEGLGMVRVPDSVMPLAFPPRPGLRAALKHVENRVPDTGCGCRVLYIQPDAHEQVDTIGFASCAEIIARRGDEFSVAFSRCVADWASPAAANAPLASRP